MVGEKTDSSPLNGLTPLQARVLRAFFEREHHFFLTGGAALVGFYLHRRVTGDLDLFTLDDNAFERGPHVIAEVGELLAAQLEIRQDAPGFKRYALTTAATSMVVDLVRERTPQVYAEKLDRDGVFVDPLEEILANKLTARGASCFHRRTGQAFQARRSHPADVTWRERASQRSSIRRSPLCSV